MGVTSTGSSSSRDEWAHRHQYRLSVEACNLPPLSATTRQPRVGAQHGCQQEEAHMRSETVGFCQNHSEQRSRLLGLRQSYRSS